MSDLTLIFVELGILLLGLSVVAGLARRLALPAIPFFLLAGLALGKGGVWRIEETEPFVSVAAEIGVLLLLLVLGLEFSPTELVASLRHHHTSGLVDLLLNAPPGIIAGWLLGQSWPACLALGGVTWVSSSGIVADVLQDLGRLGNRETPAVLSVLVLEDIAMAFALPLLTVSLAHAGLGAAFAATALASGAVLFALLAARHASGAIASLLSHSDNQLVILRVLGIMLLVAGLTRGAGASAAVGAFLVGLAIPVEVGARARAVLDPLRSLFAAIFFVAFGLSTDPHTLGPVLPIALGLGVVTVVTKVATGWFAAGRDGVQSAGRLRAGTALIPRGEFSIVIAGIAAAAGYARVAEVAAAYVLLLAVAGPIITRYSDQLLLRRPFA